MSKMPQAKYDLSEERKMDYESFNQIDTVIFLTLGSGYLRGSEHNYYLITKKSDKTIVKRTSNFQRFNQTEISSTSFPWQFLIENFDKFINDPIIDEIRIETKDGILIQKLSGSHGRTTFLKVILGEKVHQINMEPLVDINNIGNKNLDLIEKIKNSILTLEYKPSERIRYKWER